MYWKSKITFMPHAVEKFTEREIPSKKIREMLKSGVIFPNISNPRRKLCVCRESNEYFTIVFEALKNYVFIITGYKSKSDEIQMYKRKIRNKYD